MDRDIARVGIVCGRVDEPLARQLSQQLEALNVSSRCWPAEAPAGPPSSAEAQEEAAQRLRQGERVVVLFSSASLQDAALIGQLRVLGRLAARATPALSILPVALGAVRGRVPRDALQWLLPYQPRRLAMADTGLPSPAELVELVELVRDFSEAPPVAPVSASSFDSLSGGSSTIPSPSAPAPFLTSAAPPPSESLEGDVEELGDDDISDELDDDDRSDELDDDEVEEIDDEDTDVIAVPERR
jgi:hypothetical protein